MLRATICILSILTKENINILKMTIFSKTNQRFIKYKPKTCVLYELLNLANKSIYTGKKFISKNTLSFKTISNFIFSPYVYHTMESCHHIS